MVQPLEQNEGRQKRKNKNHLGMKLDEEIEKRRYT